MGRGGARTRHRLPITMVLLAACSGSGGEPPADADPPFPTDRIDRAIAACREAKSWLEDDRGYAEHVNGALATMSAHDYGMSYPFKPPRDITLDVQARCGDQSVIVDYCDLEAPDTLHIWFKRYQQGQFAHELRANGALVARPHERPESVGVKTMGLGDDRWAEGHPPVAAFHLRLTDPALSRIFIPGQEVTVDLDARTNVVHFRRDGF